MNYWQSVVAIVGAIFLGLAVFWRPAVPPVTTSADFAAWVQAWGSVAAIIGTAALGFWLQRRDREFAQQMLVASRDQQRVELERRQLLALHTLLKDSCNHLRLSIRKPAEWLVPSAPRVAANDQAIMDLPIGDFQEWSTASFMVTVRAIHGPVCTMLSTAASQNNIALTRSKEFRAAHLRMLALAQTTVDIRECVDSGRPLIDANACYNSYLQDSMSAKRRAPSAFGTSVE
ncbi:hypothetical protein [Phenylobacterium immobile]|uniref:hypothetical protein n=1 Tax=Phenylobacterium immobile TaxID=21 RepID=UPI000A9626DF|nr:hypothetical protein [Phenylobacterium immobile]